MNHKRVNILLVEDNPQDAELILRVLKKQNLGGNVQLARDGAEALEMIFAPGEAGRILLEDLKVILLDLKLPKVGGLEVLEKLKSSGHTRLIPVVALTSSLETSDVIEAYRLGANSYIVKPLEFDHFSQALAQVGNYWVHLNQTVPR